MDEVFSSPLQMPMPQQKRGGMFGGNAGNIMAAALAGFVSRRNPMPLQMLMQAQQQRQDMQARQQEYQQHRGDEREDFLWKQDHTTPQPTQTDRYLDEYMNPGTDPRRKAALGQILFPPVMGVVNGQSSIIDRASMLGGGQPQSPPSQAVDELRANPNSAAQFNEIFGQGAAERILGAGGPTPQASGGFPRPY